MKLLHMRTTRETKGAEKLLTIGANPVPVQMKIVGQAGLEGKWNDRVLSSLNDT